MPEYDKLFLFMYTIRTNVYIRTAIQGNYKKYLDCFKT